MSPEVLWSPGTCFLRGIPASAHLRESGFEGPTPSGLDRVTSEGEGMRTVGFRGSAACMLSSAGGMAGHFLPICAGPVSSFGGHLHAVPSSPPPRPGTWTTRRDTAHHDFTAESSCPPCCCVRRASFVFLRHMCAGYRHGLSPRSSFPRKFRRQGLSHAPSRRRHCLTQLDLDRAWMVMMCAWTHERECLSREGVVRSCWDLDNLCQRCDNILTDLPCPLPCLEGQQEILQLSCSWKLCPLAASAHPKACVASDVTRVCLVVGSHERV